MAKPRAIHKRRHAVQNIAKITKTMQMIATAKFKRAFDRSVAARPYTDGLRSLIARLAGSVAGFTHPLLEAREPRRVAVLAVAGNRGLCGGYNSNVGRELAAFRRRIAERGLPLEIHASGKKLGGMLKFQKVAVAALHRQFEDKPAYEQVEEVAAELLRRYEAGEIDELHVVYTKFESAARQRAVTEQVLPLTLGAASAESEGGGVEPLFDPDAASILSTLLPRSVRMQVFQAFLDAAVSEQTARMVAMKAATDNARDMIKSLTMIYNRSRQTLITTELSEIMGGAAALE
jgi:F-type H+-transporting ATPase subunit gamma